jgi:hypothetical protein
MKYAVRLHSKYTGQTTTLGSQYDTREEAEAWANDEKNICHRCNRTDIIPVRDDSYWVNRNDGFISGAERAKRHHSEVTKSNVRQ